MLANAPFASVVITHDRYFLESAANQIFELNRRYPKVFFSAPGTYTDFLEKRQEFFGRATFHATVVGEHRTP